MLDDLGVRYGGNDFSAPRDDRLGRGRIGFGVPLVLVKGAAEDAVIGPRVNVGAAVRVELRRALTG